MKTVKKSISRFLKRLTKKFGGEEVKEVALSQEKNVKIEQKKHLINLIQPKKIINFSPHIDVVNEAEDTDKKIINKKKKKKPFKDIVEFDLRDMMETMEFPFLALSKNRTKPILYQSKDGKTKVKISSHREHYVASIYDWDIIQLISWKMQEIINSGGDIPPRTLIIARHTLIKSLRKQDVRKTAKEIEAALNRLRSTLIETTIRNDDYRYKGGFGFLDSWGYTERKDIKEFRITLSDWLYDGICRKGALLKVSQEYFSLTSGLKKFLYRTARKHVGNNKLWEFSIKTLYEKSGSEQEFKKFKYDLKKSVLDNNIPDYFLEWIEDREKTSVLFINKNKDYPQEPKKIAKKTLSNEVNKVVSALKMPSHFKK